MHFFQSEFIQYAQPNQSKAENDVDYRSRYGRNARAKSIYRRQQFGYCQVDTKQTSTVDVSTASQKRNSMFDNAA
jgi:hypothetical protein